MKPATGQIYLVGGAVRDGLLGHFHEVHRLPDGSPHADRDWVVVGSTPAAMTAQGFLPVGRDFPVFLHPRTREEYALARTERKTARGYHGFAFHADADVSLEEDLARRDLTVNAIALSADALDADGRFDPNDPRLVDPYDGRRDLRHKVLRHVTDAFHEDPVRILRMARFAARWPDFQVAPETLALMRSMVEHGEVDHLVPERVWQELSRGLMEQKPSRMLELLRDCGALKVLLPEVDRLWGVPQRADYHPEVDTGVHLGMVLDMAARLQAPLTVRFACLCHDLGKGNTPADVLPRHIGHEMRSVKLLLKLCERWRVPRDCKELAEVVAREHGHVHRCADLSENATLRLLERCDAIRRPDRFVEFLQACECDARGRLNFEEAPYPQATRLQTSLDAALAVATAPIAARVTEEVRLHSGDPRRLGPAIAQAIERARGEAIGQVLNPAQREAEISD
ncbi:multifunctional CCA addition/repair protein [Malikia sp.]|uniref:multifunctional CCA addition/repair protein n=1 Tax=Malikia sp. TaxID=2070706 RepID=UPI002613ACD7|nr:multifunctional CCA addition/repair protein [Malikia sp.]MDD2729250.1 multifunctional CCA addition/repair protein [Malikia sp.]